MKYLKEIIRGIIIGVANIIPGVSGGTMAVSMGVYDKIIYAVNHIRSEFKKSILTLLPYVTGAVFGIAALSFVIGFLFENYPVQTGLGFIGLILGGVPALFREMRKNDHTLHGESGTAAVPGRGTKAKIETNTAKIGIPHIAVLLIFFAAVLLLEIIGGGQEREVVLVPGIMEAGKLFVIGMVASATMIIPGVSGSMILMLLGYYTPIINTIRVFIESAVRLDFSAALQAAYILVPFGVGIIVGAVLIAKLIGFLLERLHTYTYMGILGLVFSSPVVILMQTFTGGIGITGIIMGAACLALGYLVAAYMAKEA